MGDDSRRSEGSGDAMGADVADRIAAARGGSRTAMEELLALHRRYLTVLADAAIGRGLRAKVDASDVAQETLWKAHQGFPDFRGTTEGEFVAWLRRVLVRTLTDHVRRFAGSERRDVARERSIEDSVERSSTALADVLSADVTSPSRAAERRESGAEIAEALQGLEPDHRRVIELRTLQGRDWGDVADRMDRSPDAARVLWARALARLRPLLEGPP